MFSYSLLEAFPLSSSRASLKVFLIFLTSLKVSPLVLASLETKPAPKRTTKINPITPISIGLRFLMKSNILMFRVYYITRSGKRQEVKV